MECMDNFVSILIFVFRRLLYFISLATKGNLDGSGILSKMRREYPSVLNKIAIITGNDKIIEMLKERSLDDCNVKIFEKPLRYKEIADFIRSE